MNYTYEKIQSRVTHQQIGKRWICKSETTSRFPSHSALLHTAHISQVSANVLQTKSMPGINKLLRFQTPCIKVTVSVLEILPSANCSWIGKIPVSFMDTWNLSPRLTLENTKDSFCCLQQIIFLCPMLCIRDCFSGRDRTSDILFMKYFWHRDYKYLVLWVHTVCYVTCIHIRKAAQLLDYRS